MTWVSYDNMSCDDFITYMIRELRASQHVCPGSHITHNLAASHPDACPPSSHNPQHALIPPSSTNLPTRTPPTKQDGRLPDVHRHCRQPHRLLDSLRRTDGGAICCHYSFLPEPQDERRFGLRRNSARSSLL
ncbi:unnamed protein product [Ectocarpus sp. 12 AP-2014]